MGQQKRLAQIGNIRALAILLVVSVHSIILYSADWGLYETTQQAPFLTWLEKLMVIPPMPPVLFPFRLSFRFYTPEKTEIRSTDKEKIPSSGRPLFGNWLAVPASDPSRGRISRIQGKQRC